MGESIRDVELNGAMREKLANYMPISPRADFRYVPKIFRDSEKTENPIPRNEWPVFTLRGISGAEEAECLGGQFSYGAFLCQAVRRGVVKWDNWGDCKFSDSLRIDGKLTDAAIEKFSYMLIIELGSTITECSKLTEEEINGLGL